MTASFHQSPVLSSPCEPPFRHHALGEEGQPLGLPPVEGRPSRLVTPVPGSRRTQRKAEQSSFVPSDAGDLSTVDQGYNPA